MDPDAHATLAEAEDVSSRGLVVASQIIVNRPAAPPEVVKPSKLLESPTPTDTPPATATPEASETQTGASPTAPAATNTPSNTLVIGPTAAPTGSDLTWRRLAVGRLSTLIPEESEGWFITGLTGGGPDSPPAIVRLSNANATSLITINPRNGDMWWFIYHGDRFGEVDMRVQQPDGSVLVVDDNYIRSVYGEDAAVPLFVLDNIALEPLPGTPTPEADPPEKFTPVPNAPLIRAHARRPHSARIRARARARRA